MELETFFEYYPEIHLIAYNDDMSYFIGYELDTHKALFYNDDTCYSHNFLNPMDDAYIDWANSVLTNLGYTIGLVDDDEFYYDVIVLLNRPQKEKN